MEDKQRESFLFYRDWWESLRDNDAIRYEVYDAIMTKVFDDTEPEVSPMAKMALKFILPVIGRDHDKYNDVREKRKAAGRLGGLKKAENIASVANLANGSKCQQSVANLADNVNVNVNVNDNVNANDNDNKSTNTTKVVGTPTKRISLKEQLVNYVNELDYSEETKKALFSWIFQIGLNGKVSVKQLQDKLEYIWNIYDDESLVRQSIEEAYRNNWFGFFPLKNRPAKSPATLEKKEPSSLTTKHQDNNYSEENSRPARQKQQGCWNITY